MKKRAAATPIGGAAKTPERNQQELFNRGKKQELAEAKSKATTTAAAIASIFTESSTLATAI